MTLEQRHIKSLLIHAQNYERMEEIFGRQFDVEKACLAYIEEDEPETVIEGFTHLKTALELANLEIERLLS